MLTARRLDSELAPRRSGSMRYNLLGRTGLCVSELCLGSMTFGGGSGVGQAIGRLGQKESLGLVAAARRTRVTVRQRDLPGHLPVCVRRLALVDGGIRARAASDARLRPRPARDRVLAS